MSKYLVIICWDPETRADETTSVQILGELPSPEYLMNARHREQIELIAADITVEEVLSLFGDDIVANKADSRWSRVKTLPFPIGNMELRMLAGIINHRIASYEFSARRGDKVPRLMVEVAP